MFSQVSGCPKTEMPRLSVLFRWMTRGYQVHSLGPSQSSWGLLVPHYWRFGGRGWRVALLAYGLLCVPFPRKISTFIAVICGG